MVKPPQSKSAQSKPSESKSAKPGQAAADDGALWRVATRDVTPLHGRTQRPARAPTSDRPPEPPAKPETAPPVATPPPRAAPMPSAASAPALDPHRPAGVDKRTAQRLKRGQLAVEARIDLHGMTQDEAHRALGHFLADAQKAGRRCVLVITGKGRLGQGGGVLRAMTPRWLNEPANRARVVAITPAQPKDGGAGALYVLLRRKR